LKTEFGKYFQKDSLESVPDVVGGNVENMQKLFFYFFRSAPLRYCIKIIGNKGCKSG